MTDERDVEFFLEMAALKRLMRKSVRAGITLPHVVGQRVSPIEAAAANAADIPTVGLRFPDRARDILARWPERII